MGTEIPLAIFYFRVTKMSQNGVALLIKFKLLKSEEDFFYWLIYWDIDVIMFYLLSFVLMGSLIFKCWDIYGFIFQ